VVQYVIYLRAIQEKIIKKLVLNASYYLTYIPKFYRTKMSSEFHSIDGFSIILFSRRI
jgi:hypothetical protein